MYYIFRVHFVFDLLLMTAFGFLFYITLIAYNSGELRGIFFAAVFIGCFLYSLVLHKLVDKVFHSFGGKLNKAVKNLSKKLKISKKSLKKLLHFGK